MQSNRFDREPSAPALPLHLLRLGDSAEITSLGGGHGVVRRLAEMGLAPGARVTVVSDAGGGGPIVVRVGEARLGLGRGMARHVLVRPV